MRKSGTADLPLHGGHVPQWLSERMARLGRGIITAIVEEYGPDEVLTRISDPFWFQALGSVMGMDWHSSGITTSVMGALKKAVNPISADLGLFICGGRGKHSRKAPVEILEISNREGLNGNELVKSSKLSAKVDNSCIQDGFNLYLHNFIISNRGSWSVVQQGMNQQTGMARRYHWHSSSVRSFVSDPHTAIVGKNMGDIINLSDSRADNARSSIIDFLSRPPEKQLHEIRQLVMPSYHRIKSSDVNMKRLGSVLALAYEKQFREFTDALMLKGVGPRTLQSLALVSEIIYGAPSRFNDPARFAFAHGGKDGSPFPVPLKIYDKSIEILKSAVNRAKIDRTDKLTGLKKLSELSRFIEENFEIYTDMNKIIRHECENSQKYGGKTVSRYTKPAYKTKPEAIQLSLFEDIQ